MVTGCPRSFRSESPIVYRLAICQLKTTHNFKDWNNPSRLQHMRGASRLRSLTEILAAPGMFWRRKGCFDRCSFKVLDFVFHARTEKTETPSKTEWHQSLRKWFLQKNIRSLMTLRQSTDVPAMRSMLSWVGLYIGWRNITSTGCFLKGNASEI